jgi:CubicO group peptidase (beta-lactamase class C family)
MPVGKSNVWAGRSEPWCSARCQIARRLSSFVPIDMRLFPRVVLVAFTFAAIPALPAAQVPASIERRVDSLFAEHTNGVRPGLAVAVVRDGKVLLRKGYGYADLEHRVPITPSTVFDVASVSKQFAGLAVAMLAQQGKVKLTDDIRKYIPEMGDVGHTITVDHLLHHTSGLRDWPGMLSLAGWRYDDVISFDQILRLAYNQRSLNFAPGAEYMYSNTGYNLLAEMVRRVTGKSFRDWTDEHLFRPLGMNDSHFQDDHTRLIPNRALGYARRPDGTYANMADNLTALGSSSLFSTVDDLAKWITNFENAKVGGQAAMALTRTRGVLNDGTSIPYAFGIAHGVYRSVPLVNHSGSWAQFVTFVVHFPAQKFGVVVLANTSRVDPGRAAYDLADIFLESELGPKLTVTQSGSAGPTVQVAPAVLNRYTGLYRLGPGWYVRIRRDGNELKTQATREPEAPMTAQADTLFWVDAYRAPMIFRATNGQPTTLTYRGRTTPKLDEVAPLSPTQLAEFAGTYESGEVDTRYIVELKDGGLVLRHARHGIIPLSRLWKDDFTGTAWFTRSIEFQRDGSGRITGFMARIDDRSRDIRFTRRP